MKRFLHAKNIILWAAALFVVVTAMILLFDPLPVRLSGGVLQDFSNNYKPFEYVYNVHPGKELVIDLTKTELDAYLPYGQVKEKAFINVPGLFYLGPIIILVGGLAIVGLSFLKPCKLRGWGFILCIAIIITGVVFYVIYLDKAGKECAAYFNQKIKYYVDGQQREAALSTYLYDSTTVKIGSETYHVLKLKDAFMMESNAAFIYFLLPALPLLIVGMAFRVRQPRAPKEAPQEQPAQEQPVAEEKPE